MEKKVCLVGVPLLLKERCSTAIQLNRVSGLGKVATTLCSLIHNGEHKMQNSAVALRGRMGSGLKPRTKTEASEILSRGSFVDCLAPHIHLKSDMSPRSCLFEYLALGWCYRLWNLWDVKSVWSRWVTGYGPLRLTLPPPPVAVWFSTSWSSHIMWGAPMIAPETTIHPFLPLCLLCHNGLIPPETVCQIIFLPK